MTLPILIRAGLTSRVARSSRVWGDWGRTRKTWWWMWRTRRGIRGYKHTKTPRYKIGLLSTAWTTVPIESWGKDRNVQSHRKDPQEDGWICRGERIATQVESQRKIPSTTRITTRERPNPWRGPWYNSHIWWSKRGVPTWGEGHKANSIQYSSSLPYKGLGAYLDSRG
jgi:hypothetical protein